MNNFEKSINFINKVPWVDYISSWYYDNWNWWLKISIDINNKLSWNVIQELWHILNYLSLDERLPTFFYPISPPPYMNWWPKDYLSWVIESKDEQFSPLKCTQRLKWRLPDPVDDLSLWHND